MYRTCKEMLTKLNFLNSVTASESIKNNYGTGKSPLENCQYIFFINIICIDHLIC